MCIKDERLQYLVGELDVACKMPHSDCSCQVAQEDEFGEVGGRRLRLAAVVHVDDEDRHDDRQSEQSDDSLEVLRCRRETTSESSLSHSKLSQTQLTDERNACGLWRQSFRNDEKKHGASKQNCHRQRNLKAKTTK